jgi:hypothetical protein
MLTDTQKGLLDAAFETGLSDGAAASEAGCCSATARRYRIARGIPPRTVGGRPRYYPSGDVVDALRARAEAFRGTAELGAFLGVSAGAVSHWVKVGLRYRSTRHGAYVFEPADVLSFFYKEDIDDHRR